MWETDFCMCFYVSRVFAHFNIHYAYASSVGVLIIDVVHSRDHLQLFDDQSRKMTIKSENCWFNSLVEPKIYGQYDWEKKQMMQ